MAAGRLEKEAPEALWAIRFGVTFLISAFNIFDYRIWISFQLPSVFCRSIGSRSTFQTLFSSFGDE